MVTRKSKSLRELLVETLKIMMPRPVLVRLARFYDRCQNRPLSLGTKKKRILAVYDFSNDPMSLGDILIFNAVLQVSKEIHGCSKIDVVVINDINRSIHGKLGKSGIKRDNYYYYFSKMLPVFFVNQFLGTITFADSSKALSDLRQDQQQYSNVFPWIKPGSRSIKYGEYFNYIADYYEKSEFRPTLSVQPALLMWAHLFLSLNVSPKLPVIVHMRSRPIAEERNANPDAWLNFLLFCNQRYDVTFVLIGLREEIDQRIRKLQNVLIAKDYGTTAEQDLALIQASLFFLGNSSGPATMPMFSELPYVVFGFRTINEKLARDQDLPWAKPLQRLIWEEETENRLIAEFEDLYDQIDKVQWRQDFEVSLERAEAKLPRWKTDTSVTIPTA